MESILAGQGARRAPSSKSVGNAISSDAATGRIDHSASRAEAGARHGFWRRVVRFVDVTFDAPTGLETARHAQALRKNADLLGTADPMRATELRQRAEALLEASFPGYRTT